MPEYIKTILEVNDVKDMPKSGKRRSAYLRTDEWTEQFLETSGSLNKQENICVERDEIFNQFNIPLELNEFERIYTKMIKNIFVLAWYICMLSNTRNPRKVLPG